jgi:hypothetical protein
MRAARRVKDGQLTSAIGTGSVVLLAEAPDSFFDMDGHAPPTNFVVNSTYKKHIRAVPRELFAVERLHLNGSACTGS